METFSSAIPDGNGYNSQSSVQSNQPRSSNILFFLYISIHNEPIYLLLLCVDVGGIPPSECLMHFVLLSIYNRI